MSKHGAFSVGQLGLLDLRRLHTDAEAPRDRPGRQPEDR